MSLGKYTQEKHEEVANATLKNSIFFENKIINLIALLAYIFISPSISLYVYTQKKEYAIIFSFISILILIVLIIKTYNNKKQNRKVAFIFLSLDTINS